jgi:hypothetical protein
VDDGASTRRLGPGDALFALAFAGYAAGALVLLVQGALAAVASELPALHTWLHNEALAGGWLARVAQRAADASHAVPSAPQVLTDALLSTLNLAFAAVLLRLRPRDWTARLLAVALVGAAGVFNLTAQSTLEQLPLTPFESVAQTGAHVVAGLAYLYALLLFPDGRPVPAWSRPRLVLLYLPVTLVPVLLPFVVTGSARPAVLILYFGLLVPSIGAAAQAYRIRRADGATHEAQARLLLWAMVPSVLLGVVYVVLADLPAASEVFAGRHVPDPATLVYRVFQPVFALIPIALFTGMLRYRLWDAERLLNRTVIYGAVTGVLGFGYITFVISAELLLGRVSASPLIDSKPAVAVTTLVVAGAFRPLRDRVQAFVDRRFNRRRYDAQRTVEQFGECLRDEVDVASIAHQLSGAVDRVIQPASVTVWVPRSATTAPGPTARR